ncbi:MAG TPA: hypothetical protein QF564_31940 [Pirellulaceae bacterium]|nr:hypothetical protein [Pirellulaceae bacterium]
MTWKIKLKRLLYGKLQPIPKELTIDPDQCVPVVPIEGARAAPDYKVIYAVGRRAA